MTRARKVKAAPIGAALFAATSASGWRQTRVPRAARHHGPTGHGEPGPARGEHDLHRRALLIVVRREEKREEPDGKAAVAPPATAEARGEREEAVGLARSISAMAAFSCSPGCPQCGVGRIDVSLLIKSMLLESLAQRRRCGERPEYEAAERQRAQDQERRPDRHSDRRSRHWPPPRRRSAPAR